MTGGDLSANGDQVMYQGDVWVRLDTLPRLIAESVRRTLSAHGIVSVVRTPFQWVMASPVIEIETGGYMGDVGLYVPQVQKQEADALLDRLSAEADQDGTDWPA
ncbi:hypothetical protein EHF33_09750 [Deinococcus psychrotolerans]|uniref:DUF2007 domain-containing protein n=1 Tax=Deinococcus psychrotolerans TaxID=2489213 RepID=A0A3G8YC78_9DEIO|nr:hypothetical protein [Deinococcus psychrotolerans]AZI42989.1 hypothetical protein EHF33_09750 [Deinococcus psychrotolerans]